MKSLLSSHVKFMRDGSLYTVIEATLNPRRALPMASDMRPAAQVPVKQDI